MFAFQAVEIIVVWRYSLEFKGTAGLQIMEGQLSTAQRWKLPSLFLFYINSWASLFVSSISMSWLVC